jgi:outer membrane protein assembly factor BamE (lipoprotein component of BamABCDE complex)
MKTFCLIVAVSLSCTLNSNSNLLFAKTKENALPVVYTSVAELNYSTVSRLQRGKTTDQEIKTLLGAPTMINSDDQRTKWYYIVGKSNLHIQFNTNHTIATYEYKGSNFDAPSKIDTRQVETLVAGTTDANLIRLLGEPSYVSVSESGKAIYYSNSLTKSTLRIAINDTAGLVSNFLFLEEGQKKSSIDTDKMMEITKGRTTLTDMFILFGQPTKKVIDQAKESWYYQSDDAQLLVNFNQDASKTVSNYQYKKN